MKKKKEIKIDWVQCGNGIYATGVSDVKKIIEFADITTTSQEIWFKVLGKKNKLIAEVRKSNCHIVAYKC